MAVDGSEEAARSAMTSAAGAGALAVVEVPRGGSVAGGLGVTGVDVESSLNFSRGVLLPSSEGILGNSVSSSGFSNSAIFTVGGTPGDFVGGGNSDSDDSDSLSLGSPSSEPSKFSAGAGAWAVLPPTGMYTRSTLSMAQKGSFAHWRLHDWGVSTCAHCLPPPRRKLGLLCNGRDKG